MFLSTLFFVSTNLIILLTYACLFLFQLCQKYYNNVMYIVTASLIKMDVDQSKVTPADIVDFFSLEILFFTPLLVASKIVLVPYCTVVCA